MKLNLDQPLADLNPDEFNNHPSVIYIIHQIGGQLTPEELKKVLSEFRSNFLVTQETAQEIAKFVVGIQKLMHLKQVTTDGVIEAMGNPEKAMALHALVAMVPPGPLTTLTPREQLERRLTDWRKQLKTDDLFHWIPKDNRDTATGLLDQMDRALNGLKILAPNA